MKAGKTKPSLCPKNSRVDKRIKDLFLVPALIVGLSLASAGRVAAVHLTVLHTFTGNDGATPYADLILSGDTLYGTATEGGPEGGGTVFKLNTDGTGFTNLLTFTNDYYYFNQGYDPYARLLLIGNSLYGTTLRGDPGAYYSGTVFRVTTDGTDFSILHRFAFGAPPYAGLIFSGNMLYGVTGAGVFAINTNGSGFTNFSRSSGDLGGSLAPLVLSDNTLYGTAPSSAEPGWGGLFAVNTDSTGFTNLCRFNRHPFDGGISPLGGLILSGNKLYGTATRGGKFLWGTVFAINTDSTGLTNLHSFLAMSGPSQTNSEGSDPFCGLVLAGNTLYGTSRRGGAFGSGTIFAINTDGTGFTNLYNFTAHAGNSNSEGFSPYAGLVVSGNTLYGTAPVGGTFSLGTIFRLVLSNSPPTVTGPPPTIFECGVLASPPFVQVSDPDADPLTVVWALNGTPVQTNSLPGDSGPPPHLPYSLVPYHGPSPLGTNLLEVSVTDSATNLASCSTTLIVLDTTPPVIKAVSAGPDVLWPPNHKWVDEQVSADIADACGAADWKIIGVTSNQEDGRSVPDWAITGDHTLKLRAERNGPGGDRIYTIAVQAMDQAGNLSELATVAVVVPHSPTRGR